MSTSKSPKSPAEPYLNPERIQVARMRRGMTKVELAQRLAVTPRTIMKYETNGAPAAAAADIAAAVDFPVKYFQRGEAPTLCATEVRFRAARRATARQRESAVAAGVAGVEIDKWISKRFVRPDLDLPTLEGQGPRTAATSLRTMWGLGTKPLPNLVQLCESRGVRVYTLPPFADVVDAYSIWRDYVPYVFLARRKTPEHIRFDVAHEIGHLVLHSHEPGETTAQEREADAFASEFLIPEASLDEYVRFNVTVPELLQIRDYFKVSAMALAYAAHRASRMSDWAYRQACITLSQNGFRSGEPGGMASYEVSRVFPSVFSSPSVSAATIAGDLAMPVSDVHALTFGAELRAAQDTDVAAVTSATRPPFGQGGGRHLRVV
jgi:Zn-dependent peptidase ImmA (M78 family)/transcriptional regulator with XRE-family HTH domain